MPSVRQLLRLLFLALMVVGSIFSVIVFASATKNAANSFHMDLQVFQDAGRAMLGGDDLYSPEFPTRSGFRFIYPPFAALLFMPLAPLGQESVQVVWVILTLAAMWGILAMTAKRLGLPYPWLEASGLFGVAVLFEPIRSNLDFGQINVLLYLLVAADVLGFVPRRFRGVALGCAAAIKITPAAFGIIFLVRRDWASLARSLAAVLATVVIGFAVRPKDAAYFWTTEFFSTDRGGQPSFFRNQAVSGIVSRAGVGDPALHWVIMGSFAAGALLSLWGAWRLMRAGRVVETLLLVTLGVVTTSPYAVTHHWSGVIIALPLLFGARSWAVRAALALFIPIQLYGPSFYANHEATQGFVDWCYGAAQGISGLLVFFVLLWSAGRTKPFAHADSSDAHKATSRGVSVTDVHTSPSAEPA